MSDVYAQGNWASIINWVLDGSKQCRTFVRPVCHEVFVLVLPSVNVISIIVDLWQYLIQDDVNSR